jgi:hypothetical protein
LLVHLPTIVPGFKAQQLQAPASSTFRILVLATLTAVKHSLHQMQEP